MELKIFNPTEDGFIKKIQWNNEEIKAEVAEKVKMYTNLVYTDDQIKEAKADRAKLNKFAQALDAKRKEIKKQCMQPYEEFEKQMKEIIAIVNEPISLIDSQVKGYEEQKKQEKLEAIKAYWMEVLQSEKVPESITFDQIYDQKWLNATVSMTKIKSAIDTTLEQIAKDMDMLSKLPEFGFEALQVYKSTLDVNKAVSEAQRMSQIAKQKAEHEAEVARKKAEYEAMKEAQRKADEEAALQAAQQPHPAQEGFMNPPVEEAPAAPSKEWISFKALLATNDALALKEFFDSRNIEFMPL